METLQDTSINEFLKGLLGYKRRTVALRKKMQAAGAARPLQDCKKYFF